ncbi:hypothetical protein [Photobacterium atrarenae]|uniref:EF-hand domain-containing protein n=1 Tax=Photobacterium atrarenae TaxID=865757 RepID=A0ABY5GKS6_9GAMM|nr:hypothetical protein [Photobacterium atrarenae]UTV29319.1 hypothetical protein NNL38_12330 [Photobacterium atrarenae]
MQNLWWRCALSMLAWFACQVYAQVYPSTGTAWVLPGGWDEPQATSYFDTADAVKQWEGRHADLVLGSLHDPEMNQKLITMGYIYSQKLNCRPGNQSAWLSAEAARQDLDIEDGYLHFAEDTVLAVKQFSRGLDYLLEGQPYHLLRVRDQQFSTARLPLTLQPGDALIAMASYPFDRVQVTALSPPEVARAVTDDAGHVGDWAPVEITWQSDIGAQKQLIQSGRLHQPGHWRSVQAVEQGRALNSGKRGLELGLRTWMIRLQWPTATRVHSVRFQPWLQRTPQGAQQSLMIPGWDGQNDRNRDGYIDDDEFAARVNPNASARFRHQARLIPAGHLWPGACWYRTNFADPVWNRLRAGWYQADWKRQGLSGGYNDDMAKLLGKNQFQVTEGGLIAELAQRAGTAEAAATYAAQQADFLQLVKQRTGTGWLAANISRLNLWHDSVWPAKLRAVVDLWLREHYLHPAMGLARMQQGWDIFALGKAGDKSLIMASVKGGRSHLAPASVRAWQQDIETGLAQYYFFNLPGLTYYHSWNQTYLYGSGNTTLRNWHREGVPKNWAYQPTGMLKVDIGRPISPPGGYKLVQWVNGDKQVKSTATQFGEVSLMPANWFWLYRKGWLGAVPDEGVMARRYSDGLVVYRAVKAHDEQRFLLAEPLRVSLPGEYQRVFYDGSLSEPIRYLELGGYEGAVLKRVSSP